jgi:methionyl-tRNA formyltransferase
MDLNKNQDPKIAYLGSSFYSGKILEELFSAGLYFKAVVTAEPKRRARNTKAQPTEVEKVARKFNTEVFYQPEDLLALNLDFGLVVAYGKILKADLLEKLPMLNVHFSLLPKLRGAAPVERAILNGETITGVCLMQITSELDAGPVYCCEQVEIKKDDTKETLYTKLSDLAVKIILKEFKKGFNRGGPIGLGFPMEQKGDPTYAKKITKEDLFINFNNSAETIMRQVRLGGAFFYLNGRLVKLNKATVVTQESLDDLPCGKAVLISNDVFVKCGFGSVLKLIEVTPEGSKPQDIKQFLAGLRTKSFYIDNEIPTKRNVS